MRICGLNKTTLLDYPGRVAATVFLGSCNFRCPFCQNGTLVLNPLLEPEISQDEVLTFLKKRRGILDGVCITGGEPTLAPELFSFLEKIRALDYDVKLDSNGSRPGILKALVSAGLVQKIAMDIKSSPMGYPRVSGVSADLASIRESAAFLMEGRVDYEFRTTVVKQLHTEEDFIAIGQWLSGAKAYYLQDYRDSETVIVPGFTSCTRAEMESFRQILKKTIPLVEIRGID